MHKNLCLIVASNLLIFSSVQSADNGQVYELDDYVVSASRYEQNLSEVSPSATLFNRDAIEIGQYINLSEILNNSAGVFIVPNGGVGAATSLFTRGSESSHTAIVLNGRKLPSGFSNQHELGQISLANLQSVELIRGDSTSLYGGALSGLINLRSNDKNVSSSERLKFETGSKRHKYFDYNIIKNEEDSFLSFGMNYTNTDGYLENPYQRYSTNIYFAQNVSDVILFDFQYYGLDSSLGVPGYYTGKYWDPSDEINDTEALMVSPGLIVQLSDVLELDVKLNFSENQLDATRTNIEEEWDPDWGWGSNPNAGKNTDVSYVENINYLEALLKYKKDLKPNWIFGYVQENRDYSREPLGAISKFDSLLLSFNTNALFAQASLDVGEDSVIKIASRYTDYSNYFDHSFNRSLEYSHKFGLNNSSTIFAKSSFGSTTPEINAIMNISEDINYLNNNKLDNESMRSFELGLRTEILSGKKLGLVYFDNSINNIADKYNGNYAFVDTEQKGVEFSLKGLLRQDLLFNISYTYLDATITDGYYFGGGSGTKGDRLIRRPKHKLIANLLWKYNENINFGLNLMQAIDREDWGAEEVGDFEDITLLKLTSSVRLSENNSLLLRIDNLLNEQYEWTGGYPGAPKSFHVGMDMKF